MSEDKKKFYRFNFHYEKDDTPKAEVVKGNNLVPLPPAKIIPFIYDFLFDFSLCLFF